MLPTTWLAQLEQAVVYGREALVDRALAAAVLVASAVLTFAFAACSFNWNRKNATRRKHPALALLGRLGSPL